MFCTKCGKELPEEAFTCPACGEKVERKLNISNVKAYAGQKAQQASASIQNKYQEFKEERKKAAEEKQREASLAAYDNQPQMMQNTGTDQGSVPVSMPVNMPVNMPANVPVNMGTNIPVNMYANVPVNMPASVYANAPANMPMNMYPNMPVRIPPEYTPISMWGYFGYEILFMIPFIGFIFLLVFALGGTQNNNLKNFARSYFCKVILEVVLIGLIWSSIAAAR